VDSPSVTSPQGGTNRWRAASGSGIGPGQSDRRKDQLLQESGYLVLRFLAEDVGRELDLVLDGILRVVSHQRPVSTAEPLQFVRRGRT
jgi:uncharacterized protein DUF559